MYNNIIYIVFCLLIVGCNGTSDGTIECPSEIYDCEGNCDGQLIEDCAGECGGGAIVDCNGICGGGAIENECGECDILLSFSLQDKNPNSNTYGQFVGPDYFCNTVRLFYFSNNPT